MPVRSDQDTKDDHRKEDRGWLPHGIKGALQRGMGWVMCTAAGLLSGAGEETSARTVSSWFRGGSPGCPAQHRGGQRPLNAQAVVSRGPLRRRGEDQPISPGPQIRSGHLVGATPPYAPESAP